MGPETIIDNIEKVKLVGIKDLFDTDFFPGQIKKAKEPNYIPFTKAD